MMKLCDQCKRFLEKTHAWCKGETTIETLFHGKNMNNGFYSCTDEATWFSAEKKYKCIINLIERLVEEDAKEDNNPKDTPQSSSKREEAAD